MEATLQKRVAEKRNRPPVSCEPCRARKQKCNRSLPCSTCTRRNIDHECKYAPNANRKPRPPTTQMTDLRDRLSSLETVLSSLVSNGMTIDPSSLHAISENQTLPSTSSLPSDPASHELGSDGLGSTSSQQVLTPSRTPRLDANSSQVDYLDRGHWLSIVDDIKEVKECLKETIQPMMRPSSQVVNYDDDELFLAPHNDSKMQDIIASLPSRSTCDALVSWYFNCRFMVLSIVHPAKFQREYAEFFDSPASASPLWIALLFSVLSLSAGLRRLSGITETPRPIPPVRTFQSCARACLNIGHYRTAKAHALEAFLLHVQSCFFSNAVPPNDLWFDMGTIIRLAIRMGYHRDPDALSDIAPFDGEMRRRVWLNVLQIDALMSFQLGFPSMIPLDSCDTRIPRNLLYTDLNEGMATLPPSRPLEEYTPMTYTVAKAKVMGVFKKIAEQTQSLSKSSMNPGSLEAEIRAAYSQVPVILQRRDINQSSFTDHSCLIWERCTIELLFLKGLVVLHRQHVTYNSYSLKGPSSEQSRLVCVDAALEILHRQADIDQACGPGGRLHDDLWMFVALPMCDFLTAAMVICLDLSISLQSQCERMTQTLLGTERIELEYRSLERTLQIWERQEAIAPEAHIAAATLRLMLSKATAARDGMSEPVQGAIDMEWPHAETMGQMIDGTEEIDWGLLDQYFQNLVP